MLVIGLTGGLGSGKSTVADLFAKYGIEIIDADAVAREVVLPGTTAYQQILDHFGESVISTDNGINRQALARIIFSNDEQRIWLEQLLHPIIRQRMQTLANSANSAYCIAMIPLLVENLPNQLINRILVVDMPESLQIARACKRDNISRQQAKEIMAVQVSRDLRIAAADDVIDNSGSTEQLTEQVQKLHAFYLSLCDG